MLNDLARIVPVHGLSHQAIDLFGVMCRILPAESAKPPGQTGREVTPKSYLFFDDSARRMHYYSYQVAQVISGSAAFITARDREGAVDFCKKLEACSLFDKLTTMGAAGFTGQPPFIPGLYCPPVPLSQLICS